MATNKGEDLRAGLNAKLDASLVFETTDDVTIVQTFDDMGLKEDLLRGIYAYSEFPVASQPLVGDGPPHSSPLRS